MFFIEMSLAISSMGNPNVSVSLAMFPSSSAMFPSNLKGGGEFYPLSDGSTTGLPGISSYSKVLCGLPKADVASYITTSTSFPVSPLDGVINASSLYCCLMSLI
jgi:hypothetical protein